MRLWGDAGGTDHGHVSSPSSRSFQKAEFSSDGKKTAAKVSHHAAVQLVLILPNVCIVNSNQSAARVVLVTSLHVNSILIEERKTSLGVITLAFIGTESPPRPGELKHPSNTNNIKYFSLDTLHY